MHRWCAFVEVLLYRKQHSRGDRTDGLDNVWITTRSIRRTKLFALFSQNLNIEGATREKLLCHCVALSVSGSNRPRRYCADADSHMTGKTWRKKSHVSIADRLRSIPKSWRATFRSITSTMGIPRSTFHRYYSTRLDHSSRTPVYSNPHSRTPTKQRTQHTHRMGQSGQCWFKCQNFDTTSIVDLPWFAQRIGNTRLW